MNRMDIRHWLVGALSALGLGVGSMPASAAAPALIYVFHGAADGGSPNSLVADSAGNLFGTAQYGGAYGHGVVFELSPPVGAGAWTESVLYSFTGGDDGADLLTGPTLDAAGNLYGIAASGGDVQKCGGYGCGTVFRLTRPGSGSTTWAFTVLHRFRGSLAPAQDGANPSSPLVLDNNGNLFGATATAGVRADCCGVVFELSPPTGRKALWTETLVHVFSGYGDAVFPFYLGFSPAGQLYGSAAYGGFAGKCCGVVFQLAPPGGGSSSWTETVVYRFKGPDGRQPGVFTFGPAGDLYGAAFEGGTQTADCPDGCGTIFKLNLAGGGSGPPAQTLYRFSGPDGVFPSALVYRNGRLHGVTLGGGQPSDGVLFAMKPNGGGLWTSVTTPVFGVGSGAESLILDPPVGAERVFYGATQSGGAGGAAFSWTP